MRTYKGIPVPGLRNIKTAIAIVLCIMFYDLIGREGVLLAVTATVISMQDSIERSINSGIDRVKGTFMGGFMGIVFVALNSLYPSNYFFYLLTCFVGMITIIYVCNLLKLSSTIVVAGFVYLVIMIDVGVGGSTFSYSLNRILDTLIGIGFAVVINTFLFRPKPEKYRGKTTLNPTLHYEVIPAECHKTTRFQDSSISEIYIYPEDAFYSDKDFDFRLSVTRIDGAKTEFSHFPGYRRHLMLLTGESNIYHEGHHNIHLQPFEKDVFSGEWETRSSGYCIDYNLIVREGLSGSLECVYLSDSYSLKNDSFTGFYCVQDEIIVTITSEKDNFEGTISRGDFFMVSWFLNGTTDYTVSFSTENGAIGQDEAIAVKSSVTSEEMMDDDGTIVYRRKKTK